MAKSKLFRCVAAIMAITLTLGLTACTDSDGTQAQQTGTAAPTTSVTAPPPTETEATVTTEDLTSIPDKLSLFNSIYDTMNAAESFEMTCNIKGNIPDNDTGISKMIEHEYIYTVAGDNTWLQSTYRNLNDNSGVISYEEYQTLSDSIVTTITRYDNIWIDSTPKEMLRYSMITKALNSTGLISVLAGSSDEAYDMFIDSDVTRDDEGNYIITLNNWSDMALYSDSYIYHLYSGLIRTPAIEDTLYDVQTQNVSGGLIYTVDKNFNLVNVSFDIIVTSTSNNGYDLHGEIDFDKWNEIRNINVPKTAIVDDASDSDTDATDDLVAIDDEIITSGNPSETFAMPSETLADDFSVEE